MFNKICSLQNSLNISFWEHVLKPSQKKVISTCSFGPQHQLEKRRFFETSSFSNTRFFLFRSVPGDLPKVCERAEESFKQVRKVASSRFHELADQRSWRKCVTQ